MFSLWWVVSSTWKNSYFEHEKSFNVLKHKNWTYPCFSIIGSILLHSLLSSGVLRTNDKLVSNRIETIQIELILLLLEIGFMFLA